MDADRLRQALRSIVEQASALLAELDAQDAPPPADPPEFEPVHFSMLS